MKLSTLLLPVLLSAGIFAVTGAAGQANASINILTQNSGQVGVGNTTFIQVDIGNTGPTNNIGVNKVRAQISIPIAIAHALPSPQQTSLPPGWTILTNTGGGITVCNGSDVIAVNEVRTVLIAVQGDALGGPSTVTGVLSFGPGTGVCTGPGTLPGDITADNTSNSSIQVTTALPVALADFDAELVNCQPELHWATETEQNSDHFEIERSNVANADWTAIGTVGAHGNSSTKSEYKFTDGSIHASSNKVLYRLKMVDQDGRKKYSHVISLFPDCNTTKTYVYPNPVQNGRLYVSLTGANVNTEATLLSLSGQVLLRAKLHNGTNYLNVSSITAGVYVLSVKDGSGVDQKVKVSIQQ